MTAKLPVFATPQRTTLDQYGNEVDTIRVAYKMSPNVWRIGSTVKRSGKMGKSNVWLDPAIYDWVGSLADVIKGNKFHG